MVIAVIKSLYNKLKVNIVALTQQVVCASCGYIYCSSNYHIVLVQSFISVIQIVNRSNLKLYVGTSK